MTSKLYDCIMLNSELDMLAVRLEEMADRVEKTIIVEGSVTHRGDPKPLHYMDSFQRFERWQDKIFYVVANDLPTGCDPWVTEHAQRDAAMSALEVLAEPDDVVLIADVDEIPDGRLLGYAPNPACSLRMRLHMYSLNWRHPEDHICSVMARWRYARPRGLAAVRDGRYGYPVIDDAGLHATWLGGEEGQQAKLATTCHLEMTDLSKNLLASGRCYRYGTHHTGDFAMTRVEDDARWPAAIRERRVPASWFAPAKEACDA